MCRKLAYDWGRASPCDVVTQRFELVFLLEASKLEETVLDTIYSELLPDDFIISKEELSSILSKPAIQENVLFIIDAYDELASGNQDFAKLLKGKIYSRSMVVMTTRPSYANDVIKFFDSGYVLLGYPYHKRKEFIRKYVQETESDIKIFKTLEDNLQENDSLSDLSRIPLFLWFICLLVEDNEQVQMIARDILSDLGYSVLAASSGEEAFMVSASQKEPIDLLLTDVIMPDINGKELADTLIRTNPGLKVVFMSGYTDEVIAKHGVLEDGVIFIQKPFNKQIIAQKIREMLDR